MVVGPKEALEESKLKVSVVNWIGADAIPPDEFRANIKIRSASRPCSGLIRYVDDAWTVTLDTPQTGIAPGQAAVFYQGERVLGGGWIQRQD